MTAFLLDVNVLIALIWPSHSAGARAQQWFQRRSEEGWATSPFTEAGFLRVVANPRFSPDALTAMQAVELLNDNLKHPGHQFWPDEISYEEAVRPLAGRLSGHQQVTDAYLLGLAIHKGGKLATLDRSIAALLPDNHLVREHLELI